MTDHETPTENAAIWRRLRVERERQGLSLRKLAARLSISPSALSQIETGRSRPSVRTLFAIVTELGMSLDDLFSVDPDGERAEARADAPAAASGARDHGVLRRPGSRRVIELESGVRWGRLNPPGDGDVEFLEVTYDVGGSSCAGGMFVRHAGRERGLVLSGRLHVTVGFDEYELGAGDVIAFESSTPHRLSTVGDEPVRSVWVVVGRGDSDVRAPREAVTSAA